VTVRVTGAGGAAADQAAGATDPSGPASGDLVIGDDVELLDHARIA
jgi:hypothetical protein